VSEASRVQLAIRLRLPGRRKGSRCVKPSRKLRKARKCFRLQTVGALRRSATAGSNAVPFSGRIGTKKLKPGRYQVDVAATDEAGNKSTIASAPFTVKRR
jgi:hypothetical protein